MPSRSEVEKWMDRIRGRYQDYLRTSFYFKDRGLRESFRQALDGHGRLAKGAYPEMAADFEKKGVSARDLAEEYFPGAAGDLMPGLLGDPLYDHQERAIRSVHAGENIVVATGTASGKTESFLYPVLFDLYRQYRAGKLGEGGVRALVLYPMNALANDQRQRMGKICEELASAGSGFKPTFGQYTGDTPINKRNKQRNADRKDEERMIGELVFRDEMRANPPHILLTNYSMLEYLLIRPEDSDLFDGERGKHWRFLILDEAHQYRGVRGMEMGMLVRRLKQRLRDGGRKDGFSCIATSATIASGESAEDRATVAGFASSLFGESFVDSDASVIFGSKKSSGGAHPRRFHIFMSALEGAFLVHENGKDRVVLNRKTQKGNEGAALEIALCKECGQHYYVGRKDTDGYLKEAVRDPSHRNFGVDYYLPSSSDANVSEGFNNILCRRCGMISGKNSSCACGAGISVKRCESDENNPDQLKKCEVCGYGRGSIGDPVQEIVHGSDGPNTVIATALHELLQQERRKILSFADSRQEAAFFAWYAEDSYNSVRDRNFILRALHSGGTDNEGVSIADLQNRLMKHWESAGLFKSTDTQETQEREMLKIVFREALTAERRISLAGVGAVKWFVNVPSDFELPREMLADPWNLTGEEARNLLFYLLDDMRYRRAVDIPDKGPVWGDVSALPQSAFCCGGASANAHTREWGHPQSAAVWHFLLRVLGMSGKDGREKGKKLMKLLWHTIRAHDKKMRDDDRILVRVPRIDGAFRLNHRWLRMKIPQQGDIFECDTCASLSAFNIREVCPRNGCPGALGAFTPDKESQNHYLQLYRQKDFPVKMIAEEHTAQVEAEEARRRQDDFKRGRIHLLSSSTTFEVGVDLGDLDVAFLRNVPPEPFNYTQRAGRVGRGGEPGVVLTYCRRNPHDLYHYADPETRIMEGKVNPPQLRMTNALIILRHVTATALSAFFKRDGNAERFKKVEHFVGCWESRHAASDVANFCQGNTALEESLRSIVPGDMRDKIGLTDGSWIEKIAGETSALAKAELTVCRDYRRMRDLANEYWNKGDKRAERLRKRHQTIAGENTLTFLSRKAVIPKYGFPVDVVELDTRPLGSYDAANVSLQRDLSHAIAEYAPGGKVIANKRVWESCGIKTIPGKAIQVRHYSYDDARNFRQWGEEEQGADDKKYLWPEFGFVTPLHEEPKEPSGRPRRLYTTRPFFDGFNDGGLQAKHASDLFGVKITKASPAKLVVLCEGKGGKGFYICRACGAHYAKMERSHKTPEGGNCKGKLGQFSLGHELVTNVVRLQFPGVTDEWDAYSLAYAVLLGCAETLGVPAADLNVTITGVDDSPEYAIVLYDNVPGGAGLVDQLGAKKTFLAMLENAKGRVKGDCGCDDDKSCYGCLRSFRNQFAHPHLRRGEALKFLDKALGMADRNNAIGN